MATSEKIKKTAKSSIKKIVSADVYIWGKKIGHVVWNDKADLAVFEYDQDFVQLSDVELAPLMMPKNKNGLNVFSFNELDKNSFKGLPGMLADALPDKYGNALINTWLAKQGRTPESFSPVERLCYIGDRCMGALEFKPAYIQGRLTKDIEIRISEMVKLASEVLITQNYKTKLHLDNEKKLNHALKELISVGISAGGARAKCIIAYNEKTGEVRSGQVKNDKEFSYWILKLDGVRENRDKELNDPQGYGCREYAYYKMALDCGIEMSECRLLQENGRSHFMTKRFDRLEGGRKLHMQSLCAIAHYDFNLAGHYSYEQAINVIRRVLKPEHHRHALDQQFRRAVFNVIGVNQDDHTKNISFLMNQIGEWSLSPAYDMVFNYNPKGSWTNRHQMTINLKRTDFVMEDLLKLANHADIKKTVAKKIIKEITDVFKDAPLYLKDAGVFEEHITEISQSLRTSIYKD